MSKRWTDKERAFLKENYNVIPMKEIVYELERTATSVRSQVNYLRKRGWTFKRIKDE